MRDIDRCMWGNKLALWSFDIANSEETRLFPHHPLKVLRKKNQRNIDRCMWGKQISFMVIGHSKLRRNSTFENIPLEVRTVSRTITLKILKRQLCGHGT